MSTVFTTLSPVCKELKHPPPSRLAKGKEEASAFGGIVYTSLADEERISSLYGTLINSITTSLLSMVELSGLFRVVVAAVVKPLRLIFEKSIGSALSLALESSPEDDLKKVRFAMTMLFGDELASSIHQTEAREQDSFFLFYSHVWPTSVCRRRPAKSMWKIC